VITMYTTFICDSSKETWKGACSVLKTGMNRTVQPVELILSTIQLFERFYCSFVLVRTV
jgi:hypothetical protein